MPEEPVTPSTAPTTKSDPAPQTVNPVIWSIWAVKNFNSNQLLILLVTLGITVLFVDGRTDRAQTRAEMFESMNQSHRETESLRVEYKQDRLDQEKRDKDKQLEIIKTMNTHCLAADRERRLESGKHMEEAMNVLRQLKDEISRLRGSKVDFPPPQLPECQIAPMPRLATVRTVPSIPLAGGH